MRTKGWKEVFKFTFTQQVKTKSFIISTIVIAIIVALIAFLADFLPTIFLQGELDKAERAARGEETFSVDTLYIDNETGYDFNFDAVAGSANLKVQNITADEAAAKIGEIADTKERVIVSVITFEDGRFFVDSKYSGGEADISKGDCESINMIIANGVKVQYLMSLGVPEDQVKTAMSDVSARLSCAGKEELSGIQMMLNSVVPMISSIILFIFIFSYSQLVAQSVAIEKSSRMIEYLLTSIKPFAIIIGKVLAMCCVSLLQFFIIGFGGAAGFIISLPFGIISKANEMMSSLGSEAAEGMQAVGIVNDLGNAFSGVNASVIIVMILSFVLGFLFFAGLAGLAGASVSKMEDLSSAIQPLSIIGVLGFYLAYFPQITGEDNMMTVLARYIPISSPFIIPADYLLGRIGIAETIVSILVMLAADVIVMMLVAKVYEAIILHTGNRLKLGDMLKMSK